MKIKTHEDQSHVWKHTRRLKTSSITLFTHRSLTATRSSAKLEVESERYFSSRVAESAGHTRETNCALRSR